MVEIKSFETTDVIRHGVIKVLTSVGEIEFGFRVGWYNDGIDYEHIITLKDNYDNLPDEELDEVDNIIMEKLKEERVWLN